MFISFVAQNLKDNQPPNKRLFNKDYKMSISKEKVCELSTKLKNSYVDQHENTITEWLEQNQPEPIVVGITDELIKIIAGDIISNSDGELPYGWRLESIIKSCLKNNSVLIPSVQGNVSNEVEQLKSQQLTPSWDDAPEWANWLAQDKDGMWNWYESEPKLGGENWYTKTGVLSESALIDFDRWKQTLEQRPKPTPQVEVGQVWKHKETRFDFTVNVVQEVADCYCVCAYYKGAVDDNLQINWEGNHIDFLAKFERVIGGE